MKQSKLKVAITGGIGSGKTTACGMLKEEGYPVYSCDKIYAELFDGGYFNKAFCDLFGKEAFDKDGRPSRANISRIVFLDSDKLHALDKITHPEIFRCMFERAEGEQSDICFFEVPLLFEGGYENLFDKIAVIVRGENERIESIMARDNLSKDEAILRLKSQYNYKNNDLTEYYVIHNNGKLDDLRVNLLDFIEKIKGCG